MPDEPIYVNGKKEITASKLVDIADAIRAARGWDPSHKLTINQMYDELIKGQDLMPLADLYFGGIIGPKVSIFDHPDGLAGITNGALCNQKVLEEVHFYTNNIIVDSSTNQRLCCNCPRLKYVYFHTEYPINTTISYLAVRIFYNTILGDENDTEGRLYVKTENAKTAYEAFASSTSESRRVFPQALLNKIEVLSNM